MTIPCSYRCASATAGDAIGADAGHLVDAPATEDPHPSQLSLPLVNGPALPKRQVLIIGGDRFELPERLDQDWLLRESLGRGNFGVVHKCASSTVSHMDAAANQQVGIQRGFRAGHLG